MRAHRAAIEDRRLARLSQRSIEIRSASPTQIEAIDMGRRGVHNDGSQTLMDRLDGKISIDFATARRLFTLICVLHWRG